MPLLPFTRPVGSRFPGSSKGGPCQETRGSERTVLAERTGRHPSAGCSPHGAEVHASDPSPDVQAYLGARPL